MSDEINVMDQEALYDDCRKIKESYEHISKEFKSYEEYCSYIQNNRPTVQVERNSTDVNMSELFENADSDDSFYALVDTDSGLNSTNDTSKDSD